VTPAYYVNTLSAEYFSLTSSGTYNYLWFATVTIALMFDIVLTVHRGKLYNRNNEVHVVRVKHILALAIKVILPINHRISEFTTIIPIITQRISGK
jgi:hypothetical protein